MPFLPRPLEDGKAAMVGPRALLLIGAMAICQPATMLAQVEPGQAYAPPIQRFSVAPKVGEPLPDLTIVAADGSPVNLREVAREHYTVLVLGCLT